MSELVSNWNNDLTIWQQRIETAWQRSVASVIEVGKLIKEAKENLGVSYALLETQLPFSSTVAAFLVKISEHPVLSNPAYHARLPNSYNTLYHLASIDQDALVQQIEDGRITPNFTLVSAKALRAQPASASANPVAAKETQPVIDVGRLRIMQPKNISQFHDELKQLLEKYGGSVSYSQTEDSLAELHRSQLLKQVHEQIRRSEKELRSITYHEIRALEDAAHYLQKERNQTFKGEIEYQGKTVLRTCLPPDHEHYEVLSNLLGEKVITRARLKQWCIDHKVPSCFTEIRSIDKKLYVWEQARLILERKDAKGALKRLSDIVSYSPNEDLKKLATKILVEVKLLSASSAS